LATGLLGQMIALLLHSALSVPITYSSCVQLKSVYTKNRIGITTESNAASYRQPVIHSSRPPYKDGWFWTIEPDEENASLTRTIVQCGSILALSSTITNSYLSTKAGPNGTDVVPATSNQGAASQWILACETGPEWRQGGEIMLQNLKYKCWLQTGFDQHVKDAPDKYTVTCGGIAAGAVWRAVEGMYFPTQADEIHVEEDVASGEL
jgi:hypothetical protein